MLHRALVMSIQSNLGHPLALHRSKITMIKIQLKRTARALRRAAAVLAGAIAITSCATTLPQVRYRLTVIVDTPEGRRSGGDVLELVSSYMPAFPSAEAQGIRFRVHGEAVPVELPGGRYIFAVMKWGHADDSMPMLIETFADLLPSRTPAVDTDEVNRQRMDQVRALAKIRARRPIKPEFYPVLVYFDDLARPETIHALPGKP